MGGGGSQRTNQTTTTVLPRNQQQNVDLIMQGARDYYNSGGPQYFPGQTLADPSQWETLGRQLQLGYAQGQGGDFARQAVAGDQFFLNPSNIYNPSSIPGFDAAQQGVVQQVTQNLQRNILPGINGAAVTGGNLGGSRQQLAQALAVGDTNTSLSHTLADMNMQAFNSGLNMYNSAANRAGQTYALGAMPGMTMDSIGAAMRSDEQARINDEMDRYNAQQLMPYMNLQMLKDMTGTAGDYGGVNTSQGKNSVNDGGAGAAQIAGTVMSAVALFMA